MEIQVQSKIKVNFLVWKVYSPISEWIMVSNTVLWFSGYTECFLKGFILKVNIYIILEMISVTTVYNYNEKI